jgi:phosphatidyl-myo-inositol alpha-mannosyltransferase
MPKKMHIAVYSPYHVDKPGGVQDHIRLQAKGLIELGHRVTILTPRPRKTSDEPPKGYLYIGRSARLKDGSTSFDLSSMASDEEIDEVFAIGKFDILHVHEPLLPWVGRCLIVNSPIPVVTTFHAAKASGTHSRLARFLKPIITNVMGKIDVMTRVSDTAADYLTKSYDLNFTTVPNFISLGEWKQPRIKARRDPNAIVFVGRLESRKGVQHLIDAFAVAKQTNPMIKLAICGDGPMREQLEQRVQDLEIAQSVTFHGYIDEKTKREMLACSQLYISPATRGESFGIVLLEAMAAGIPLLAGDNPGYASIMTGVGQMSLVSPLSTEDFARRINLFMQEPTVRQLHLDWAKKHIKQYDYKAVVPKYEAIYRSLLS